MTQFLPIIDINLDGKNHIFRINFLKSLFELFPERDVKNKEAVFKGERRADGVEVVYTIEDDNIITVTVYVFYGKWKEQR